MAQKVSSAPVVAVPSGNLDAALGYARRGCAVLPVRGKGKGPLTAHGVHDNSTDESVLRGWWARWPSANVGIATGSCSGLIVLDVDGDEGRASLRALQNEIGSLAPTRRVKTGRGEHLYLACSQPIRTQQLAPGLELRGDGSYVVAPPSRHPSGACYEVIEDAEPAPLPDRLGELLAARFPTRVRPANQTNIATGERNKTLTSLGGTMRRRGMTPEAIETALLAENAARCAPPLPEAEVRRIAGSVARYQPAPEPPGGDQGGRPSKESQATKLVALASDAELFHAPDQTCYATIKVGTHFETWPIRSTTFRRYIAGLYYFAEKKAPGSQAIQDAVNVFEARALFSSPQRDVFVRVAEHDGSIWLDLGDAEWRAVQISSTGWHVIGNPAVGFRRSRGMLALPAPVLGGTISDMFPFLNLATEEDRVLVLPWMVGALRPRGPYPILCLHGEQGTAKSTTARVIRALIDPNVAPLRSLPREERDLQISARNSHLVSFDNVSRLGDWVSDSLCRLATGGGLATRQLYSDDEEILFDAQRPVLLNGIEELAAHGDFLDRSIIIYLPQIAESARRDEFQFWNDFERIRPRILGTLLDAVSVALRDVSSVKLAKKPRMADFSKWAVAAEPALRIKTGAFLAAYNRNRKEANQLALEGSLVAEDLLKFMADQEQWEGTVTELLQQLNAVASENTRKQKRWPKTARGLSGALRRLAPNLRAIGISVAFLGRKAGTGHSQVALEKRQEAPSQSSLPSQDLHAATDWKQKVSEGGEHCEGQILISSNDEVMEGEL